MSLKVGITGGIGSGKSYVSKVFKALGIPFYDADKEAKRIMAESSIIKQKLIEAFGQECYFEDGTLNRQYLSSQVFIDERKLKILNDIVHPVVIKDAVDWSNNQNTPYNLKEAALLYESGSYKNLDYTILVTAPTAIRVVRVMLRDGVSEKEVLERMSKQMPEKEKEKFADYIIVNDGKMPLLQQILDIHTSLLTK